MDVIFWEKPGCVGNARQKAVLEAAGHRLEVRDLLRAPWTAQSLRPFFGARPVAEWFNAAAPRVRSSELRPDSLTEAEALALMLDDPLLIRRPLMQVGEDRRAGFETAQVAAWIGLDPGAPSVNDACPRREG
ncbi:ArsC/Spx/MgsR family protein [Rhodobacter maris]|uniref:Nitrogenase-associated protein n=1 Tax=Rhodobacter maris TaxID=446682 RepID=A0A285STR5_9RHOB|nr:ArsC/Spx/MgsR family protein [Rhodobacter maris]SOC11563.1 nitrogenase-associated protein [Rhodobacter maris]